jgi:hypothetical protein
MSQPAVFVPGVNVFGEPITFQRDHAPIRDTQRGNHDWQDEVTIDNCVVLVDQPATGLVGTRTEFITQGGALYVPRGPHEQLVDNMRFWYLRMWYGLISPPRLDFNHVLTGENWGYVEYTIVKGGSA